MAIPSRRRSPTVLALVALLAGLLVGAVTAATDAPVLRALVRLVEPLGTLWVNAIRMTLVPLVVSLLVTSVAGVADVRSVGRLGARAVGWFLALLVGASLLAALAAPPLIERLVIDPSAAAALRASAADAGGDAAGAAPELPTVRGFVVGLVPTNPVSAAAEAAMLPLIVFVVLFAAAVTRLPVGRRAPIVGFFTAVREAMLVVVGWVLRLTPIGVFALAATMGAELGIGAAGAVGYYVVVLCALVAVATLACYPVAALFGRTSMARFARAAGPAQMVAISTRSSLASLPALVDGARRHLGDRPAITGFVLPLAVSTFKLNTPIADLVGPLFLAHLYGIDLSAAQIATMTIVSVALSFSNPGIPSGGLFVVTAPVLLSAGLPLDGIGLLIAADAIPDVFNTVVNVTGDMTVATVLSDDATIADAGAVDAAVTEPEPRDARTAEPV